jgi:hypothetical protein
MTFMGLVQRYINWILYPWLANNRLANVSGKTVIEILANNSLSRVEKAVLLKRYHGIMPKEAVALINGQNEDYINELKS